MPGTWPWFKCEKCGEQFRGSVEVIRPELCYLHEKEGETLHCRQCGEQFTFVGNVTFGGPDGEDTIPPKR